MLCDTRGDCAIGEACEGHTCTDLSEGRVWAGDENLDPTYGTAPEVAVSRGGFGAVAWGANDRVIRASLFDPGIGTWTDAVDVQDPGAPVPSYADVGADDSGNAIVVWHQGGNDFHDAWSNRYDAAAGVWEGATRIEQEGDGFSVGPSITMDPAGNALVVWPHLDENSIGNVQATRYDVATGTWSGVVDLFPRPTVGGPGEVTIERDGEGNAFAVWEHYDGEWTGIAAARFSVATSSWSEPVPIGGPETGHANHPRISADGDGNFFVVWHQATWTSPSTPEPSEIWTNRYDRVTSSWGTSERIDAATGSEGGVWVDVAGDHHGNALAVWKETTGLASAYYDGGTGAWSSLPQADDDPGDEDPRIAADPGGNGIAIFRRYQGVFVSRFNPVVKTWSEPVAIDETLHDRAQEPKIGMDETGRAIAAWYEIDQPNNAWNIIVNRFE
jgi:hypothetical protein